jgi:hypothetical protein
MRDEQSQAVPMTDADVLAAYQGDRCAACNGVKAPSHAFCATDFSALPMPARWQLQADPSSPQFAGAFRSWLRHLQLHPHRRTLMTSQPGSLPYRNWDEFHEAGYRFSRRAQCGSKLCLASIVWVITPERRYLALDEVSLQPHARSCKDPGWHERRKERLREERRKRAQTSARRRRVR